MPSRPPLSAVLSGTLLPFLAPSYRATPGLHPTTRRSISTGALSGELPITARAGSTGAGAGGRGRAGEGRQLSGLARVKEREEQPYEAEWNLPVASTSAVRLDPPSPFPPLPAGLAAPLSAKASGKRRAEKGDDDAFLSDPGGTNPVALPAVLTHLRKLHSSSPDASPLSLVDQLRASPILPFNDDDARQRPPPTPPPPIRLDPQLYSSSSAPLLTPFLLQALFLGASALGLLARRKVRQPDEAALEARERENDRAKREAEEKVDELQALNLLVGALGVPEASGIEAVQETWEWRKEKLQPLLGVVRKIEGEKVQVDRLAIASVVHFVSVRPPVLGGNGDKVAKSRYESARPVLAEWALGAFEGLKAVEEIAVDLTTFSSPAPSSLVPMDPSQSFHPSQAKSFVHLPVAPSPELVASSPPAAKPPTSPAPSSPITDDLILLSLLSIVYQEGPGLSTPQQRRIDHRGKATSADRRILNAAKRRVLDDAGASPVVLEALARAAVRAVRPDVLVDLLTLPSLSPNLRLFAACLALDLLSRAENPDAGRVLFAVDHLIAAVEQLEAFGEGELDRLHWVLVRLGDGRLTHGVAFESELKRLVLRALKVDAKAVASHPRLLPSVLAHLVRSRHPRAALAVLRAIPPHLLRIEHYEPVLRSSHLPTAQSAWSSLLSHPTLAPFPPSSYTAFLRSHASCTSSPTSTVLPSFHRLYASMRDARIPFTLEAHNLVLRVLVKHASDPAVRRQLWRMRERDGIEPDERTWAVLAGREMRRGDGRKVTVRVRREVEGRGEVGVEEERLRRGGGKRQMRKVVEAVRELQVVEAKAAAAAKKGPEENKEGEKPSLAPNILLKSLTRWTREVDVPRLVEITKDQVGVDLSPLLTASSPPSPSSSPSSPAPISISPLPSSALTWPHFASHRRPALLLLKKAFENRGRMDLGRALGEVVRREQGEVGRAEKRRKRGE